MLSHINLILRGLLIKLEDHDWRYDCKQEHSGLAMAAFRDDTIKML